MDREWLNVFMHLFVATVAGGLIGKLSKSLLELNEIVEFNISLSGD